MSTQKIETTKIRNLCRKTEKLKNKKFRKLKNLEFEKDQSIKRVN